MRIEMNEGEMLIVPENYADQLYLKSLGTDSGKLFVSVRNYEGKWEDVSAISLKKYEPQKYGNHDYDGYQKRSRENGR